MKQSISAEIIADSKNEFGDRIITYVLTYPRIIHAELLTHRMFSRNSASSRAIPFKKMCKLVEDDPFIPIAFQKDHKGMQGTEYLNNIGDISEVTMATSSWLEARNRAVVHAKSLNGFSKVTKQLCNRLLEPFQWYKVIVTATEYDNFFELRCPQYTFFDKVYKSKKDVYKEMEVTDEDLRRQNKSGAEIHIQALAECMWDAKNKSKPKVLKAGEWHIPFGDRFDFDISRLVDILKEGKDIKYSIDAKRIEDSTCLMESFQIDVSELELLKVKIATARCARISYNNFEGKDDYEADIKLYNRLESMKHASPFEHCAQAMSEFEYKSRFIKKEDDDTQEGWCRNFKGFIQLRHKMNL